MKSQEDATRARSWADRLAFGLSAVASPFVVLPVAVLAAVFHVVPGRWGEVAFWSALCIFFSTILPLGYIWLKVCRGEITDIHVMIREQRREPFFVALTGALLGLLVFYLLQAPRELLILGLCLVLNGFAFAAITLRWKISLHPSVLAASILVGLIFFGPWVAWFFLLVPPVLWARIHRRRHSLWQGLVAIVLALAITRAVLWLLPPNLVTR